MPTRTQTTPTRTPPIAPLLPAAELQPQQTASTEVPIQSQELPFNVAQPGQDMLNGGSPSQITVALANRSALVQPVTPISMDSGRAYPMPPEEVPPGVLCSSNVFNQRHASAIPLYRAKEGRENVPHFIGQQGLGIGNRGPNMFDQNMFGLPFRSNGAMGSQFAQRMGPAGEANLHDHPGMDRERVHNQVEEHGAEEDVGGDGRSAQFQPLDVEHTPLVNEDLVSVSADLTEPTPIESETAGDTESTADTASSAPSESCRLKSVQHKGPNNQKKRKSNDDEILPKLTRARTGK
ncbi:hypothetical protein EDD85DRAFT_786254 [Armillaria nabsnona]|nr:hypothetical protein EDD85DRAFT_786254 [Armillaria nabsnona]